MIRGLEQTLILVEQRMNPDLDTLATRLYVTIDDLLIEHPQWAPERPTVGITPKLTDAELLTLAVLQALLGFTSEARFIRHAHTHLRPWFPYLPDRPGYNKRLRHSGELFQRVIASLARACPSFNDDLWLVDSTPVECGRNRETVKRSDLAGRATYGYCASHSRFFWGLRLHLITTPSGLPVAYALAGAKTDERDTALDMIALDPGLHRPGQILMGDKGYRRADFETELNSAGITFIRPTFGKETPGHTNDSCDHSARSSSRSTRPSRPNSTSNATAHEPNQAPAPESCNDSSRSPPPSGTTKPPTSRDRPGHCSPTTTDNPRPLGTNRLGQEVPV
jgi:hypothetical protein